MRSPVRSERDALRFVLLVVVALAPVATAAALAPAWLALTVLGAVVVVLAIRLLQLQVRRRRSFEVQLRSAPPHLGAADQRRILVIANDVLPEEGLALEIERIATAPGNHVRLLAPVLSPRRARWSDATDRGRAQAAARLEEFLGRTRGRTSGEVSDSEPLQAIEDALATFAADEIVIATRTERPWEGLEPRLAALVRDRFALPVAHLAFAPVRPTVR